MRLCFFGLCLTHKGGVENLSVNLIRYMAQSSDVDEIYVVCEDFDEDAYTSLEHRKITVKRVGRLKKSDFLRLVIKNIRYRRLSDRLKGFDVLHLLDLRAYPFVRNNISPFVVTIHDVMAHEFARESNVIGQAGMRRLPYLIDHYWLQMFLELLSAKRASKIVVNNVTVANQLSKLYGNLVAGKIHVIPPGFDPERFNPYFVSRADAKHSLKIESSSKVLLHVGGSKERKGLPHLLHALDFMRESGELDRLGILLLVLGRVNEKYARLFPSLKEYFIELPYAIEDVLPTIYRAADVLVMPSTSEGWGIALIQALACGTPVIASQHVPSALATEDLGAVCIERETNSPRQLAKSILTILNNKSNETRDWSRILSSLILNYSWENVARSHLEIYKKLRNEGSKSAVLLAAN